MKKKTLIAILIIVVVIITIVLICFNIQGNSTNSYVKIEYKNLDENTTYENRIFDTSYMHEINIKITNEDLEDLKNNPLAKTKYPVDVIVDGIEFKNVSIKTKGNSSLRNIVEGPQGGPASNRFSFKIDFGKYEKDQTYYGLDKLHLNNIYGDATYLNDYISYELFRQLDVPAPLCSYIFVKINNEDLGLYLAVEDIGKSFLTRNNLEGNLYKPEQLNGKDNGASLSYFDEDFNSYFDIFNNAETIITEEDKINMIEALKKLNEQKDLKSVLNVEEIIKYFVVHNFVLSYDSYTGKSIHNYFLNENKGILSMIPWDYNLSFGRYNMSEDINTIVNYGIDTPLNNASIENRPMWKWIVDNEEYLNYYHEQYDKLMKEYVESGKLEELINKTYTMFKPYITYDISSFYGPRQIEIAVQTLKKFCELRSESIRLQLDGLLSTKTFEQVEANRVDASSIDLNKLGLVADDSKRDAQASPPAPPSPPIR